jgi:hypothetical protein
MGAEKRSLKRAGKFAASAAQRGGSFETSCLPNQIIAWLKTTISQVVEEAEASISVRPVFKSGKVGTEVISVHTSPGSKLTTRVVLTVRLEAKEGNMNLNAIGPVAKLMECVGLADTNWQPI